MRAIILAAGQDVALDGMIKCLIRHPADGRFFLEHAIEAFAGMTVTVVVGYRALEIIQRFPQIHYVVNEEWAVTNNAYSLGLALDNEPCIVVPGDMWFRRELVTAIMTESDNLALTSPRENRGLTAIHCVCDNERIVDTYTGPLHDAGHDELLGMFKLSSLSLLRQWKSQCLRYSNLFIGQTLPVGDSNYPIVRMRLPEGQSLYEINTVTDYLNLVRACA